ncbi:hypothetical protein [Halovenus sp. HT40]|uniref:hypothetical protein n=1 Tax=Halovenus sp. HT40 TaxID=3126691 RepID=UPI00300F2AB8
MARKLALYVAAFLGALFAVQLVVSAVFAALAIVWSTIVMTLTVALLLTAGYGTYKLYGLVSSDERAPTQSRDRMRRVRERDPVERLRDQYASGEISERELERGLERELSNREMDSIDRELQRERR